MNSRSPDSGIRRAFKFQAFPWGMSSQLAKFAGVQSGIGLAYWLESMRVMRNILFMVGGLVLLGGATGGGCGLGASAVGIDAETPRAGQLSADGGSSNGLSWIGIDSSVPLAVGTTATIAFEVGATPLATGSFQVDSSDFNVISITQGKDQTLTLTAVAPGTAAIELWVEGSELGSLALTVAQPEAIAFADPSHLAAGIADAGIDLPPAPAKFAIVTGQEETIQAVITDATGDALASAGLVQASGTGLIVTADSSNQFILQPGLSSMNGTFTGSLGGAASVTYDVEFVYASAVMGATLETRTDADGNVYALAVAVDGDGDEIFGLGAWTFVPSGGATSVQLADAATKVILPKGTVPASVTLTAQNGSLTASALIP